MEPVKSSRWSLRQETTLSPQTLADELGIPLLVAEVLSRRGLDGLDEARLFLSSRLADLPDPDGLPGMSDAVNCISRALEQGEKILVHGDYDVDGISGATLLVEFLRACDADVDYFIPIRLRDGYGLSSEAVRTAAESGVRVLLSVDCGISAVEEAALAAELGIKLVITDHHQPPEVLPEAVALVNPQLEPCDFPFRELAGVGVAFFLVVALRRHLRDSGRFQSGEPDLRDLLDLAALGTIADVVPLKGVNRQLVKAGLQRISQSDRSGMAALLEVSGVARVTCGSVGFQLAPRLNAAGRLEDASLGVELLLSDDNEKSREIATKLDLFNRERREIEQATLDEAIGMVDSLPESQRSIVLWANGWHPGVIGIVASRLVERFHRPTLMIAMEEGEGKASARSISGFNLFEGLSQCRDLLLGYGGHAMAAGFSVSRDNLQALSQRFEEVCTEALGEDDISPLKRFDTEVQIPQLTMNVVTQLEQLAPYGAGNPEPLFCLPGVSVQQMQRLNGGHLRFTVRQGEHSLPAIAFSMAERAQELDGEVDLLAAAQVNRWNGRQNVQLVVKDVRPAGESQQ